MKTGNDEVDRLVARLIEISKPADGRAEGWDTAVEQFARLIYRGGANAALSKRFGDLDDNALSRLRWLAEHGMAGKDILALVSEVEEWREKARALKSDYGVTDDTMRSMLAEGFHTAFRKATDHPTAMIIHRLITEMPGEDWGAVTEFVSGPILSMLRAAQLHEQEELMERGDGELHRRAQKVLELCQPAASYGDDRGAWQRNVLGAIAQVFHLGRTIGWDEHRLEAADH